EFLVYEALHHLSSLKLHDLISILDKKNVFPIINSLLDKDAIVLQEEIYEKYKPKLERYVKLDSQYSASEKLQFLLEELSNAPKQRDVIMALFSISAQSKKPVKVSELSEVSGASAAII